MLDPELTVQHVIEDHPQTIRAFIALRMNCVGCYLMRFCSLSEVAKYYNIELQTFLAQVNKAVDCDLPDGH